MAKQLEGKVRQEQKNSCAMALSDDSTLTECVQVAILTGGNSGIGLSTAHQLVAAGAEIAILDISPTPSEHVPLSAKYIPCNVADEDSVNAAVKETADHFSQYPISHPPQSSTSSPSPPTQPPPT